jgi:formylglycine-generating enzyme required for sulfatase activity
MSINGTVSQTAEPKPDMVLIDGGTFVTDIPTSESDRFDDEYPERQVTVSPFYMGKYTVTQAEYQAVMGINPRNDKGDNLPAVNISWYNAVEYCNRLSQREGLTPAYMINEENITWNRNANGYRLPAGVEWEYAAMGGNGSPGNYNYSGSNNADDVAWYSGNSGGRTHEVGKKAPNGLGLYDMSGNVWEWCWDRFNYYTNGDVEYPADDSASESGRMMRGGSFFSKADYARSLCANDGDPYSRAANTGFRLARS